MDKTTDTLCESIVPLPGAIALPPLPWDLDTTNPRLNILLKVGELVTALHRWGHEVYLSGQSQATRAQQAEPLTEQQVADMIGKSDLVSDHGYLTILTGGPIHARIGFLTSFANHVLAAPAAQEVTQQAAPELYTCIDKGGEYELIGDAVGAGEMRGTLVTVYRDTTSLDLFYRSVGDFSKRMQRTAATDKGEAA